MSKYRTAPESTTGMPSGISYIIGNEAAERFSFYGMKAILAVFMTKHLVDAAGQPAVMTETQATFWTHIFVFSVYITPLIGALIADVWLGKFRTIMLLSCVYCLGHVALAVDETRFGLAIGLSLIAIGSGGIKPCVSAHVGDQFSRTNQNLLAKVFGWFYFAINSGAFASMLLTPWLLERFGPHVAFGIPAILMGIATIVFWMGRMRFAHIPPNGMGFVKEIVSGDGWRVALRLSIIYLFVAMFWSLFDQTSSMWVFQAEKMDRMVFGYEILSSQMQAANPLLILILIPIFSYVVYPLINRVFTLTPLRKISIGFFITIGAFALPAWLEMRIDAGDTPSIAWQALAYLLMTIAEVMISITCLEFSYTQSPKAMKSFIMSLFLASVAIGNLFTALVNKFIQDDKGNSTLSGPEYYWFFTGCITVTAFLFIVAACFYKEKTYIHGDEDEATMEKDMTVRE